MADVQKPVQVPETTPAITAEPVVPEATAVEPTAAAETPAVTEAKTEETPVTDAAAPAEEAKKEVIPIEKGRLDHKASPASFPKNLIFSSQEFWFGSEPVASEKLTHYIQSEKATDVAHHVAAWAAETGKGLLFYGKESSNPTGVIQLAEASEPTTDGHQKFTVVTKGHKHVFKAANSADRDNWVEQLKLKIAEAKELATTVTESESYKKTLETLKPTPAAKKEEKPVVAAETPAAPATEETAAPAVEAPKEEAKEEPKRRSASRKRTSIFGSLLNKKEEVKEKKEEKKEDKAAEETPAVTEPAPVTEAAVAPVAEAPVESTETAPVAAEEKATEAPKEKPVPTKRASLFGSLSFGKKRAEPEAAAAPVKETAPASEVAPVTDNAPVIPAVETTEPLSAEVASPATVPTETTEVAPATNGETKKEVKSEKRKSSMPFAFGKKEKSASSDEETEKKSSPFSKLRQTIKGKGKTEKAAAAPVEETPVVPETAEAPVEPVAETEAAPAVEAPVAEEATAEKPAATPAVAATA